jgi:hypothetical protein
MSIEVGLTEVGWAKIGEPRRSLGAFRRWGPNAGDIEAIEPPRARWCVIFGAGLPNTGCGPENEPTASPVTRGVTLRRSVKIFGEKTTINS